MTENYCYCRQRKDISDNYSAVVCEVIKLPFILSIIFNGLFAFLLMQNVKKKNVRDFQLNFAQLQVV